MNTDRLAMLVARFSDQHKNLGNAAEAILADYYVPRSMNYQLARSWLIAEIHRHRYPDDYEDEAEDEAEE